MICNSITPEIYLFNRNRTNCYGVVKVETDFKETIRFNSCSEISFTVTDKFYDTEAEKWTQNPIYSRLIRNNLLFLNDATSYFSYPVRTIGNSYTLKPGSANTNFGRASGSMTFNDDSITNNFKLQPETLLFNVSLKWGYNWQSFTQSDNAGGLLNYPNSWSTKFPYVACSDYIPIQPYDVIATRTSVAKGDTGSSVRFKNYHAHFYTENDASTYVGTVEISGDAIKRWSINRLARSNNIRTKLANGGYVRFTVETNWNPNDYGDTNYASFYRSSDGLTGWSFPYDGWLQIYSGERYCLEIENENTNGMYDLPMQWFVIKSVEEESDGISSAKTVTAYSYEYTLSNRSISLSESTMPLYIPPQISSLVNGNGWVIDKEYGTIGLTYATQKLGAGLLNRVLELLPAWSIGHISSKLMTRYRSFDAVDNADIYKFLMGDVESAYQCYFVFDNNNMTISAYTQEDIVQDSGIALTWDNAIKKLKITDSDTAFVTALRGHTSDDTYGLGLVNPTGDSVLYNFNSVLDEMDFVADSSDNDPQQRNQILDGNGNFVRYRTLKEAVTELMNYLNAPNYSSVLWADPIGVITVNNINDYRTVAKNFVRCNMEVVEVTSRASERLAEYRSIADKINIWLKNDFPNGIPDGYYIGDNPRTPYSIENGHRSDYANYHSKAYYLELLNASKKYFAVSEQLRSVGTVNDPGRATPLAPLGKPVLTAFGKLRIYKYTLQTIARRASLNYDWQVKLIEKYNNGTTTDEMNNHIVLPILTPAEILALQPFIYEGDWTNENTAFSETYSEKDIIDTLTTVYNQLKADLDTFISKEMFDFEADEANWIDISEMIPNAKRIRMGKTLLLNTENNKWVQPILLELYKNYSDPTDFKMTFTTDYTRKPLQFRFADLYGTITQISVNDSTFTFNE